VSDRFKDFYRDQLDSLNKTISELPPNGPSYDQRDKECLQAEVAKSERLLGISPDAGLETAIAFASSKDPAKIQFGISELGDIDTPQAKQQIDTLAKSSNGDVAQEAKRYLYWRSKAPTAFAKQFERLR
jgi:hypothetical protein